MIDYKSDRRHYVKKKKKENTFLCLKPLLLFHTRTCSSLQCADSTRVQISMIVCIANTYGRRDQNRIPHQSGHVDIFVCKLNDKSRVASRPQNPALRPTDEIRLHVTRLQTGDLTPPSSEYQLSVLVQETAITSY